MKISKSSLVQIIKEELENVLEEAGQILTVKRHGVNARTGPNTYYDVVKTVGKNGILERGTKVHSLETKGKWIRASVQGQEVWLPQTGFYAKPPRRKLKAMSSAEAGDTSASPAGLAAASKG